MRKICKEALRQSKQVTYITVGNSIFKKRVVVSIGTSALAFLLRSHSSLFFFFGFLLCFFSLLLLGARIDHIQTYLVFYIKKSK